jgi:hypothetical protein
MERNPLSFYHHINKKGYVVLPKVMAHAIPSSKSMQPDIKKLDNQMHAIFKRSRHLKRFQSVITEKTKIINKLVQQTILFAQTKLPHHSFDNAVLLKSIAGCEVQPAHSDYPPPSPEKDTTDILKACGLILSIMPNTTLTLWEGLRNNNLTLNDGPPVLPTILTLEPGDVLLFMADQIHAGSAYDDLNYRIHIYVDSPAQMMGRTNTTWRVDQNGPSQPNRVIELLKDVPENDFKNYLHVIESPILDSGHREFYEVDSLTEKELNAMIKDNGILCYTTPNIDALQGNANPYPAPFLHTRRSEFLGFTKCLWYKCKKTREFKYFAFDYQTKDIQMNPDNLQQGITLFWVQEKNPQTNTYWPENIQVSVIYASIDDS